MRAQHTGVMREALLGAVVALVVVAPAAATAATVQVQPGVGIVYSARSGEVNRLQVGTALTGLRVPLTEFLAPLMIGAGCVPGTPVVCREAPVVAHLGDMDDIASVAPFFDDASVFAGAGDDDVSADGQSASASGGSGNDVIRVNANGSAVADGGAGDDQIAGGGGVEVFDGGNGNDLIVPVSNGVIPSAARGQQGDDVLVARSRFGSPSSPGSAAGNGGDDVITFLDTPPNGWTFDGGRGDDVISGPALTVDAGPGNDLIDVVGDTPSTVTCGAGFDVVWADSSDVLSTDCERRIPTSTPPVLPGVAEAIARARALLNHVPHPDPGAS